MAKLLKNPQVKRLGECLAGAEANLVEAGKIVIKLRQTVPKCDQMLLELFPQHLTPYKLERLVLCGQGNLIPDFIAVQGTLGKKLLALSADLQRKVHTEGVEVVIGGTASRPTTKRFSWHELQPSHAAQAFNGAGLRTIKEQVAYRVKKVKSVSAAYSVTDEGLRVTRGCLIPWLTLARIVKDNLAPLTGVSRAAAPAQAAVA